MPLNLHLLFPFKSRILGSYSEILQTVTVALILRQSLVTMCINNPSTFWTNEVLKGLSRKWIVRMAPAKCWAQSCKQVTRKHSDKFTTQAAKYCGMRSSN